MDENHVAVSADVEKCVSSYEEHGQTVVLVAIDGELNSPPIDSYSSAANLVSQVSCWEVWSSLTWSSLRHLRLCRCCTAWV